MGTIDSARKLELDITDNKNSKISTINNIPPIDKDRVVIKNKKISNNVIIKSRKGSYGGGHTGMGSISGLSSIQNNYND